MTHSGATRTIAAPIDAVWSAFTEAEALEAWMPPGGMTAKVHSFDLRPGGGYEMSLYYPAADAAWGKTTAGEDRVRVRFVEISQPHRLVETASFATDDPALQGEMRLVISLTEVPGGTEVAMRFEDLPPGLNPADNDEGARLSLDALARRLEA